MKPTQNFRMSKQTKRMASTITDNHARALFKSAMIQAQLMSEVKPPKEKEKN